MEKYLETQKQIMNNLWNERDTDIHDNTQNPRLGDILDYIGDHEAYADYLMGIESDASYLTESSLRGKSTKERIIMLADFLLKYKGCETDSHLYWFKSDKDVINGRICNIPLIEFAKLNNDDLTEIFRELMPDEGPTDESNNPTFVKQVAILMGYQEKELNEVLDSEENQIKMNKSIEHISKILANRSHNK